MNIIQASLIAIIEGVIEILPVSSTAHIILMYKIFNIKHDDFSHLFLLSIQIGSIIAIIHYLFNKNIIQNITNNDVNFYKKIIISLIPIIITGLLIKKIIIITNIIIISLMLLLGGVLLIISNKYIKTYKKKITYYNAILIGISQCLSILPGLSRSGITITAGILQYIKKDLLIYYSFCLAVPTSIGALSKKIYDIIIIHNNNMHTQNFNLLKLFILITIGSILSFFTSKITIKYINQKIKKNNFYFITYLGYYRIILSIIITIIHLIN